MLLNFLVNFYLLIPVWLIKLICIFNKDINLAKKLGIDLDLRPQNLDFDTYFNLTKEYENLRC